MYGSSTICCSFWQFSKRSSDLATKQYFNFENSSFVVHFTVDQTGVRFGGHSVSYLDDFSDAF